MKTTITTEHSTATVKVVFEKEEWVKAQEKAYKKLGNGITIKGFRKGKAPLTELKRAISQVDMFNEAYDSEVQKVFEQVVNENKIFVVARPEVTPDKISLEEFELTYKIPVKPEFELSTYKGIEIPEEEIVVTDEEIQKGLEEIQQNNAEVVAKEEGGIEVGDVVRFDFEGFVDGVPFEGGKAEGYELEIGSHQFIPGFEEGMVGLKKGEEKDLEVSFPEQYAAQLAGKKAVFKIKVHEISTKVLPEINDDLALDANMEGVFTLEELKAKLKHNIEHSKAHQAENKAMDKLIDAIVANHTVEISELEVKSAVEEQFAAFKQDVENRGMKFEQYLEITGATEDSVKEQMKSACEKQCKARYILSAIGEAEKIEVTQEDIDNEFKQVAEQYNMEFEKVKEILSSRINEIAGELYGKKLTDFLRSVNKVQSAHAE